MWVALENIRSLYNVGSVMRTAGFFGVKNMVLVGYSGIVPLSDKKWELNDKVKKTSLGAEKDLKILYLENSEKLIEWARKNKLRLIAVEQDKRSIKLSKWRVTEKDVVVFGNEIRGVSKKILDQADKIVEIPRLGRKGSLNVATVAGIVMEKFSRQV